MKKKISYLGLGLFISLFLSAAACSFAEEGFSPQEGVISNVLIILDSSGSMSEKTKDQKEKLASAKKALGELLDSLPAGLRTGLIVYGHRRKGDCADIQLVCPLVPLNKALIKDMKRSIKNLKPLGVTPIAGSLVMAGETLKRYEGENSIILISDGKETCDGDPVRVARELEEKYDIKVYVDVIGFDVRDDEREELEAIAIAGRGRYYSADTAKELSLVTKKAALERKVMPAPKETAPPPQPAPQKEPEAAYVERGEIERLGKLIRGGNYYDNAVEIEPGEYRLDHKLRPNEFDYFKIKVKNGQRLNCSVRTTELSQSGGIAIHSSKRTELCSAVIAASNNAMKSCFYEVFDLPEKDITLYVAIGLGAVYSGFNEHVIYGIWLDDHFDADSGTDAGNYFDTAIEIKPGRYEENWACFGDVDMYKLEVEQGDELSLKIIPRKCERYFMVDILNEDRETLLSARNKEKGSILKTSLVNISEGGQIYLKVSHGSYAVEPSGNYAMEIEVKKASANP